MSGVQGQSMDRGSEVLKYHLGGADVMEMRQTRRGFREKIRGGHARTEFKYVCAVGNPLQWYCMMDSHGIELQCPVSSFIP